jgi:hypothetical protein
MDIIAGHTIIIQRQTLTPSTTTRGTLIQTITLDTTQEIHIHLAIIRMDRTPPVHMHPTQHPITITTQTVIIVTIMETIIILVEIIML